MPRLEAYYLTRGNKLFHFEILLLDQCLISVWLEANKFHGLWLAWLTLSNKTFSSALFHLTLPVFVYIYSLYFKNKILEHILEQKESTVIC